MAKAASGVKTVNQVPMVVEVLDADGRLVEHRPSAWRVLPPREGACQVCGRAHSAEDPHDPSQLYYQVTFRGMLGRDPTWADAMAHCVLEVRRSWEHALRRKGHWSEPPAGEAPVAHHGLETK